MQTMNIFTVCSHRERRLCKQAPLAPSAQPHSCRRESYRQRRRCCDCHTRTRRLPQDTQPCPHLGVLPCCPVCSHLRHVQVRTHSGCRLLHILGRVPQARHTVNGLRCTTKGSGRNCSNQMLVHTSLFNQVKQDPAGASRRLSCQEPASRQQHTTQHSTAAPAALGLAAARRTEAPTHLCQLLCACSDHQRLRLIALSAIRRTACSRRPA